MKLHRVRVAQLPSWLDAAQLLGEGSWSFSTNGARVAAEAELDATAAADVDARLRKLVLGGAEIAVEIAPALSRPLVRRARLEEARRRRERSEGFTRSGVKSDESSRLGLTPERLAVELGRRAGKLHVLDTCCGIGGNAIGFARAGCRVTAIELLPERLEMAQHNARVYGVVDRITWHAADARALVQRIDADLWFVDVPWDCEPLLFELLALRAPGQRVWAKVAAAFDPAKLPTATVRACFGTSSGDARRVKFLVLELQA